MGKKVSKKKTAKKVAVKQETTPREDQKRTFLQSLQAYKQQQAADFQERFGRN